MSVFKKISKLENKRKKVDKLDYKLLKILSTRFKITDEIGELKKINSQNIVQPERWEKMIEDRVKKTQKLGIKEDVIKSIFSIIHNESVRRQN